MLYVVFEQPRKPYPITIREYAVVYRSYTGTEVVFKYDGSEEVIGHDLTVSRRIPGVRDGHARIFKQADKYYIVDLCSTNGTLVDGYLLKGELRGSVCESGKYELRDGSLVVVGFNTAFRTMFTREVETLPAGAFIIRSVDELEGYPVAKKYMLNEKNAVVKLSNKPGVYGSRVKLEESEENRKFTTTYNLLLVLQELLIDVVKEDADRYSRHAEIVLDILKSEDLGIRVDETDLILMEYILWSREYLRENLRRYKGELENAIRKVINKIQLKYQIPIPI